MSKSDHEEVEPKKDLTDSDRLDLANRCLVSIFDAYIELYARSTGVDYITVIAAMMYPDVDERGQLDPDKIHSDIMDFANSLIDSNKGLPPLSLKDIMGYMTIMNRTKERVKH